MKTEQIQQAKDWLAQNNYDDDQYVFLNGNSPYGVDAEGQRLEEVLADYAQTFKTNIEMKTEIKTIQEIIDGADCPLPIETIPNYMGVNLCSVEAISWTRQDDNQLVNLTIHFIPNNDNL